MPEGRERLTIRVLHLTVGAVVLVESLVLATSRAGEAAYARAGLPVALRLFLGWGEAAAALLFLIPATLVVGGWALIVVFFAAALLHVLHGQYNVGSLAVLAAAVIVVMAHRAGARADGVSNQGVTDRV